MPKTVSTLGINPHTIDIPQSAEPPLLPADCETSALTLLLKEYFTQADIEQVWVAYRYAFAAHDGQTRKTGEPYITHPVAVACILAKLHLDLPTLLAALLHDVVEDTGVPIAEISERFGKQVGDLVEGLTKLDKIEFQSATVAQAENFRKMLLAMSQDVRVILVKLADRLHNMQTL
jgi:GTP diphosphokinase / guanosine-3',5'-bis(diphosphate) 3'-diphosphatase